MENILRIQIPKNILEQIQAHGEEAYPEEGAGLLLGVEQDGHRTVKDLLLLDNAREDTARHNRYLITAEDMLKGEMEAERQGYSILGIFHSHPDHPNRPSEYDREFAIPWYSYLITSIHQAQAGETRCWRLQDDRGGFTSEQIDILD